MEQTQYIQLASGYEAALDTTEELAASIAELQDELDDTLDDLQDDVKELTQRLRRCVRNLQRLQSISLGIR